MAIGFYITMVTVAFTFQFYGIGFTSSEHENHGVAGLLLTAHQKSIDYRLKVRGPRKVSPNVALIAVDERAVETIGRWPWPRAVIAQGVENAMKYGAKVLAFDVSFAEASANPAEQVLEAAKAAGLSGEIEKTVADLSPQLDNDDILGKTLAKHANRIVAGTFSTEIMVDATWNGDVDFCLDMIFKMTPTAKQWDKEDVLVTPNDPFQATLPTALQDLFRQILTQREKDMREKIGAPKSRNDEVLANQQINKDLRETCGTILEDFRAELNQQWAEIVQGENNPEFKYASYDEWLADYRSRTARNGIPYAFSWNLNTPVVAQGTKHTAFFNTEQDPDGTIRGKVMLLRTGNSYFPSLSLKAFLVAQDMNVAPTLEFNPASGRKELTKMEVTSNETGEPVFNIPTDGKSKLLLNYAGPQKMYPYVSFADLLSDSPEAIIEQRVYDPADKKWKVRGDIKVKKTEFFKDKIFVVGATAMGIYDLRVTPFEENYPGAETHLNAIDNILSRNFFRTLPDEQVYMPIVLGVVGLVLSIALSYLGALAGLLLTLSFLIGVALFDQYYLFNRGMVVTVVWPVFLISFLYVALTFYRYLTEERGKKELRQTFQKYVSPAIVEEILAHPQNIELGGKKVNLTVFFSDVRGFTTISEKLDPRALSDLLNSYLTPMTDIVFKNRGTLDKYMGDAIMAFFGAPVAYPDHAKHACRCALLSVKKLFELQKDWAAKGLPTIDLGIGLNTGEVSVGNMGSETVRSYTVMGDAVNLASRLEGINKTYGTRIILSEMTYNHVKDNFVCREVDWVRVKGKALPVKIYELLAEEKVPVASMAEMLKWFQEGYEHYHMKAWDKGLVCFSKVLDKIPTDEVSKLYVQRCQDYLQEPPAPDWDGVFVMKTK